MIFLFTFKKDVDDITIDDMFEIRLAWHTFGVWSSKKTKIIPMCLLHYSKAGLSLFVDDLGERNRIKGTECRNISSFMQPIYDKVTDNGAILNLH